MGSFHDSRFARRNPEPAIQPFSSPEAKDCTNDSERFMGRTFFPYLASSVAARGAELTEASSLHL